MHPKVACRDIHTRIICIFRLFWRLFMQTGSSWVGWCYWSGVIYQAKFIPTSHYETLNLGKLLHILRKRLCIKRPAGGGSHARHNKFNRRVKNIGTLDSQLMCLLIIELVANLKQIISLRQHKSFPFLIIWQLLTKIRVNTLITLI